MKILIIHNSYSQQGGEESVVAFQQKLLEENGHQVNLYSRDYDEMKKWWFGRIGGFFSTVFNPRSIKDLRRIIRVFQPEVAILHNLFPIISPAIIPFLKKNNIRTVQILHNYRLLCPIGTFFTNGQICEKCIGKGREWHCLINRCNGGSFFQSLSYTFRHLIVRKFGYFKSVEKFIALSHFQKTKLVSNGFDDSKIAVIPNSFFSTITETIPFENRTYIGFVGRLSREKGILDFIHLASLMPDVEFRVAGKKSSFIANAFIPENIKFEGFLGVTQLKDFYSNAKVIVFPSRWYEGFPMTLLEAFSCMTPVIVYNLSVMPEIVEDGKEGFVVEVGDTQKIREKIACLLTDEKTWTKLSENSRNKYLTTYSVQSYYHKFMLVISKNSNY